MTREEFVDRFNHPFLLRRRLATTMDVPTSTSGTWDTRLDYDTQEVDINTVPLDFSGGQGRRRLSSRLRTRS